MSNVSDSIARMKQLALYGTVNEDEKKQSMYTLCEHVEAADGKVYGIVKECNRYYIKYTTPEKATLAESYQYVSGPNNKMRDAFSSHNSAVNFFDQKINSINESHDSNKRISSLDPFKKESVIEEGKEAFAAELARQRQIMYNAAMLLGESNCCSPVKGGEACHCAQPEAPKGSKGDKMDGAKDVKPDMGYKGSHTNGVIEDGEMPNAKTVKAEGVCPKCGKNQCECNEEVETDFDNGMNKGREPKTVGWDMEGQKKVNEDADEKFSEGLPSSAGVGEADTDHNNDPFNKNISEGCVNEWDDDEDDDILSNFLKDPKNQLPSEKEMNRAKRAASKDITADADEEEPEDVKRNAEGEIEDAEDPELDVDDMNDDIDNDFDNLDDEDDFADGEPEEDDFADEDVDADDFAELEDEPIDEPSDVEVDESDPESIRAEIERLQSVLDSLEDTESIDADAEGEGDLEPEDDDFAEEDFNEDEMDDDFADDELEPEDGDFAEEDFGEDEMDDEPEMFGESKRAIMNRIVESVVKQFVNEDELHDFGKHPGYRKKPMTLPTTGEDKNEHGEDWNDESCHNEEPFGKQIGNGDPFNQMVDAVTKDVMYQLKHGVPIEKN